jgi:hypothetical protein
MLAAYKIERIRLTKTHLVDAAGFCSTGWMNEGEEVKRRRRRSTQEIQRG